MSKIKKYIKQIKDPSDDFKCFLNDYFTGHPMIRGRAEEDYTVWHRLKGYELELAKQMILDNLGHDSAYMRAISVFRDERGIPLLKNCVDTLSNKHCHERLTAAKILYDWIDYPQYLEVLESTLPNCGAWTKLNLDYWIEGLDYDLAKKYIIMMLKDKDEFVRFCAYETMKRYLKLKEPTVDENKYYTSKSVYDNQQVFSSRLQELEEIFNQFIQSKNTKNCLT